MRSRTELVTTTFIDSEEDQSETDDSEEDWRPVSNRNGRKRSKKRRNKRKAGSSAKSKRKMVDYKEEDSSESDYQKMFTTTSAQLILDQKPVVKQLTEDSNQPDKSGAFNLYIYKKDLDAEYKNNSHLCLWRRDGSSLLQKYIRVKTNNCEEFLFTSSSVYSSWDERRRKDFTSISVKWVENNNRRVTIQDPSVLSVLAKEMIQRRLCKTDNPQKDLVEDTSNDVQESQEEEGDDYEEEEEDEEISGEDDDDDVNSAKTSDGEEEEEGEEEDSTNEATSNP